MKMVCWNVRGLGDPRNVRRLRHALRDFNPSVVFFSETKLQDARMARIRQTCGFNNGIEVSSVGRSGGLSLAWKDSISITLRSFSVRHIDVLINDDGEGKCWRCTGFYGAPEEHLREASWDLLRLLNDSPEVPWLVMGDFNEIMYANEKQGGLRRSERQMAKFREVLFYCSLSDIGYSGSWYTWERGRTQANNIRERLDRGVGNGVWWDLFPNFTLNHMTHTISDHCPLLLDTTGALRLACNWPCKFEACWLAEDSCEPEVLKLWNESERLIPDRLNHVCRGLNNWFREIRRLKSTTVDDLRKRLEQLWSMDPSDEVLGEIIETKLSLNLEADKDEVYWEQRARANWLRNGDRNTAFFHRFASGRRRKNRIKQIVNSSGATISDNEGILLTASEYFQTLFTSQGCNNMEAILHGVRECITQSMNDSLNKPYTYEEVCTAVKTMVPLKASGIDGLGAIFYQKFWHIIGREVADYCISLASGSANFQEINETCIVLIPKVKDPSNMTQFRPISLCNVLYKIASKMLANRFKSCLDVCINEAQCAFVPGRLITDNILIAYEMLHSFKNRRVGLVGQFALKLDMSKAYDRVEWQFLESMMLKLGFNSSWVSIIMNCVRTMSYSVSINGFSSNIFSPSRGLRQGDPLSPYLFLICSEGLSTLLNLAHSAGNFTGARINRYAPVLTHLLFADDSLIFSEASAVSAHFIKDMLSTYAEASGQLINYDKSGAFFSSNVVDPVREEICGILGVTSSDNPEKYLGLPALVGRNKMSVFKDFKDKFEKKNSNWCIRGLSMGSREVFIKSVL
ncbi:hypothetical protein HRI_002441700 [Hibiscus trionum]|uniref:Reverse transcriptase domain-containing protein n=1 Tax=Hibiscus trionum TaxID=183268 RepID=A0A9W7M4P4_HIBTR|nr:hypothetical protein HRI_002441700 [Hibiscus trionum]